MRRTAALFVMVAVALGAVALQPQDRVFIRSYDHVLGTSLDLKIQATSGRVADVAADAVLAEIARQSGILSGYDRASEFSRWMNTRDVAVGVSPELFEVLQHFDQWRARTDGALDAAAETVSRVWKASASAGRLPTDHELADAVSRVRQTHWRLDPERRTATRLSDAPLVLNTFTKSYIVDRAAGVALRTPGVRGVVVNIGGDLVVRGQMDERVAIADPAAAFDNAKPLTHVAVRDLAVHKRRLQARVRHQRRALFTHRRSAHRSPDRSCAQCDRCGKRRVRRRRAGDGVLCVDACRDCETLSECGRR